MDEKLNSVDVEARREAVLRLGEPGTEDRREENVRLLLKAMQDMSWRIRKTAVDTLLGNYPVESFVEGLIQLLYLEDNAGARNTAIESLIKLDKKVTDYLIDAFDTTNHDVRKFIIDIIGEIRDKKSVPLLISALKDEDENVSASAVEHLGTLRESSAVGALIDILEGDDLWTAYPAADALGMIGDKSAVPALLKALAEKKTLREPVLKALGRLGDIGTIDNVVPFIKDRSHAVQGEALNALETMYQQGAPEEAIINALRKAFKDEAIEVLVGHAKSERTSDRRPAILFMGLLRDERALEPLLEMSSDEEHVDEVKKALVFIGKAKPEVLLPLFYREYPYVKRFISEVARDVASPVYFDTMLEFLGDEDGHVRSLAALSLGNIGDGRAIIGLIRLFSDPYEDVQEAAVEAVANLKGELNKDDLLKLLESHNALDRKNAALLMGRLRSPEYVAALGFAQKDGDISVRRASVKGLSTIKTPESVEYLTKALTDEDPDIRTAAALSLGNLGSQRSVEGLCLLLKDAEEMVRVAAARALGVIRARTAVAPLIELLADNNGFVVIAAITALGRIGGSDAKQTLQRMLGAEDAEIKRAAISSLAFFESAEQSIIPFLKDEDWATRAAAAEALSHVHNEIVRTEFEMRIDEEDDPVVLDRIEKYLDA